MFGIGYFKAQPTEFVRKVAGGRVKREGQALSFFYLKRRTSIVVVPISSADAAFVFNEQTGNYQAVTIQGQLTYRIVEPRRTMEMLNYVVDPKRRTHVSQDPECLDQRIVVAVQMETRRQVEGKTLEEVLGVGRPPDVVVNVAKYLRGGQLILAFNPDPSTIDGVLIPFRVGEAGAAIRAVLRGDHRVREVTMARATLGDGQSLLAFNDLFIGRKTHISARYHLTHGRRSENQSSSGIIVSTGAGSTDWLSSVLNGAAGVLEPFAGKKAVAPVREGFRFAWDAPRLCFSVREPFISKASAAGIVWGNVRAGEKLEIVSQMPQDGVIFSDGV
jgi:hypothetical protein